MKAPRSRYEAVTFRGPDPASSPLERTYTDDFEEAKDFARSGNFGYVRDTRDDVIAYRITSA